jgi:hypothetical protein
MKLVMASTAGFLLALLMNLLVSIDLAMTSMHPEIPHWLDQRYLFLAAWGFPLLAVWAFNARWLPVFLGLRKPSGGGLMAALSTCDCGGVAALLGQFRLATGLLLTACILASIALRVFQPSLKPAKTLGVSPSFPLFRARRLHLASCCGLARYVRGSIRCARRHLGRLTPRSHRRFPRHHGVRHRSESPTRLLWDAPPLQQEADVHFSGLLESRLPSSRGL